MTERMFKPIPERCITPMVILVNKSLILSAINQERISRNQRPLHPDTKVTFKVPSGGDYSGCEVEMNDGEQILKVRWEE